VETNPPRNNRLRLIHTDEHGERRLNLLPQLTDIGWKDRHASENSGKRRPPRNFSLTKQTVARFWGPGIEAPRCPNRPRLEYSRSV
jgi:hypothetical protein